MFCKNCGKEVAENAYVCTGCGCLVDKASPTKTSIVEEMEKQPANKITLLLKIFLIISITCAALGFACTAIACAASEGWGYSSSNHFYVYVYPNFGWSLFAFCYSFFYLGTAIPAFIFGLKEKKEQSLKFISLMNFIISIISFITISLLWILSCNTL